MQNAQNVNVLAKKLGLNITTDLSGKFLFTLKDNYFITLLTHGSEKKTYEPASILYLCDAPNFFMVSYTQLRKYLRNTLNMSIPRKIDITPECIDYLTKYGTTVEATTVLSYEELLEEELNAPDDPWD